MVRLAKARALAGVVAAVLLLGACTKGPLLQGQRSDPAAPLRQSFALVTDIPVPSGARLDIERSIILGELDHWTGRVMLDSKLSATEAFSLYQSEMPQFGWEPIMSVQAATMALAFVRGERAATVLIEERALTGSSIAVTVAPRQPSQQPAMVNAPPVN